MCDDDIHVGRVVEPTVSRRTFGLMTVAAAGVAGSAQAATPVVETEVTIRTPDGEADAALYHPEGKGKWPAVLLWTDVAALRPAFREMGRRLSAEGYVVLVPNVYYRSKKAPVIEPGFDFNKPEDRARLMAMRATLTPEAVDRDAGAYIAFLDARPQTDKKKKIGTQGYCMGGALSFRTAAVAPNRVGAVASFHGSGLFTDKPDSPHLLIGKSHAEYLILIAGNDHQQDPTIEGKLRGSFAEARRTAKIEVYETTKHGWCVPGSAVYDQPAADKAWAELLALYKRAV